MGKSLTQIPVQEVRNIKGLVVKIDLVRCAAVTVTLCA